MRREYLPDEREDLPDDIAEAFGARVRLLLETNAAVAFLEDDPRLGAGAAAALEDSANHVLLSVVVLWE